MSGTSMDQCNHEIRCDYCFCDKIKSIDNYIFSKIIILRCTHARAHARAAMIVNLN